jgi:hypothetical protein
LTDELCQKAGKIQKFSLLQWEFFQIWYFILFNFKQ